MPVDAAKKGLIRVIRVSGCKGGLGKSLAALRLLKGKNAGAAKPAGDGAAAKDEF